MELWWTGVPDDCPDPLLVADAVTRVLTTGAPVANRRALSPQELAVGPCSDCGGVIVLIIYGLPGMELFALAGSGQAVLGGCVLPEDGPVASYACARCRTPVRLSPTASDTR